MTQQTDKDTACVYHLTCGEHTCGHSRASHIVKHVDLITQEVGPVTFFLFMMCCGHLHLSHVRGENQGQQLVGNFDHLCRENALLQQKIKNALGISTLWIFVTVGLFLF